jgi:hypothetical protein
MAREIDQDLFFQKIRETPIGKSAGGGLIATENLLATLLYKLEAL